MNEKPIERLNYYNGQRLEADDFKLEQEYHIRVRRWLNKSLYSAGIADGLEVKAQLDNGKPTDMVIVSPGLALDSEGREMILLEESRIKVVGQKSETEGEVEGNYLFIQYREETMAREDGSCTPKSNGQKHKEVPWGGPSRVRAKPILGWSYSFPHASSGKVVLAQVELDDKCNVRNVHNYLRRYIGPASNMLVHQYALEGERHIDASNPGRIYFHIRGRQPNAVTMYLRAEKFSTLYYTELGGHNHLGGAIDTSDLKLTGKPEDYKHFHNLVQSSTITPATPGQNENAHSHEIWVQTENIREDLNDATKGRVQMELDWERQVGAGIHEYRTLSDAVRGRVDGGGHEHVIPNTALTGDKTISFPHSHQIDPSKFMDSAGVKDLSARGGDSLRYVNNMQVYIGKADTQLPAFPQKPLDQDNHTKDILNQLDNAQPTVGWLDDQGQGSLGDGQESHTLAKNGTGQIRLDLLSPDLSFPPGDYYIQLHVDNGGGRILYNLYVE